VCTPGSAGIAVVLDELEELAASCEARIEGIGIGCTGPVDPQTGLIGHVDTILHWKGLNLIDVFGGRFGVPVAVENDADAAALAEYAHGCGRGSARFLYVTVSTGIGGGAVFDGRLYRGVKGNHPEFGHHVLEASGPLCYCGARGCWESLAAGPALAASYGGITGRNGFSAREVCQLAASGDAPARAAVDRAAFFLGAGLANLVTMFAPEVIALGGGVTRSWPLFDSRAREALRAHCRLVPCEDTRLLLSTLGDDLPLAGAAEAWFHRYS
jgi:glucokinase